MKKEDKIKLVYDHSKSYMWACFSAVLIIAFGVTANLKELMGNKIGFWIFTVAIIILGIGFSTSKHVFNKAYHKLLGGDKPAELIK